MIGDYKVNGDIKGCPKCGRANEKTNATCPFCGYNFGEITQFYQNIETENNEMNSFSQSNEEIKNEKYLRAYVGKNYDRLNDGSFSYCSFLLEFVYWAYRGMLGKAYKFLFVLIGTFALLILPLLFIFIVPIFDIPMSVDSYEKTAVVISKCCNILEKIIVFAIPIYVFYSALTFKSDYMSKCNYEVNKKLEENSLPEEELIEYLERKGKPKVFRALICAVIYFVLLFALIMLYLFLLSVLALVLLS